MTLPALPTTPDAIHFPGCGNRHRAPNRTIEVLCLAWAMPRRMPPGAGLLNSPGFSEGEAGADCGRTRVECCRNPASGAGQSERSIAPHQSTGRLL